MAVIAAAGLPTLRAEPDKVQQAGPSGNALKSGIPGKYLLSAKIATNGGIRIESSAEKLASAVRALDLRKLTMSDFGDTEQTR